MCDSLWLIRPLDRLLPSLPPAGGGLASLPNRCTSDYKCFSARSNMLLPPLGLIVVGYVNGSQQAASALDGPMARLPNTCELIRVRCVDSGLLQADPRGGVYPAPAVANR